MILNDFKPLKKEGVSKFIAIFDAAHISIPNCDDKAGDTSRKFEYEIFSIKRRF